MVAMAVVLLVSACAGTPVADKIAGSYSCTAVLYTRVYEGGEWIDTSFTDHAGNTVTIGRVDDETVRLSVHSERYGDVTCDAAGVCDFDYAANFTGKAAYKRDGQTYEVPLSGTVTYDPRRLTVSLRVADYPASGGKYVLAFTTVGSL